MLNISKIITIFYLIVLFLLSSKGTSKKFDTNIKMTNLNENKNTSKKIRSHASNFRFTLKTKISALTENIENNKSRNVKDNNSLPIKETEKITGTSNTNIIIQKDDNNLRKTNVNLKLNSNVLSIDPFSIAKNIKCNKVNCIFPNKCTSDKKECICDFSYAEFDIKEMKINE
mgnify:FL=1